MNSKTAIFLIGITLLSFLTRTIFFGQSPPALYWDEISLGYNAYSIVETGRDEWGIRLPLWFKAYGEYKLPVYIYSTAILINLIGFNDYTVRLPSILAGSFSPLVLFFIIKQLTKHLPSKNTRQYKFTPYLGAIFFAISPWSIQFSRGAFEANLALFFILLGTFFYFHSLKKNHHWLYLSTLFFILSIFTYNSARIFSPLWFLALLFLFPLKKPKKLIKPAILGLLLLLPTLPSQFGQPGLTRLNQTTYFLNHSISQSINIFTQNFLSLLDTDFLFFHGDQIGRHSTRKLGMMYFFDLPLILLGFWSLSQSRQKTRTALVIWIILGLLPAVITQPNPHALRSLNTLPALIIVSAIGASVLIYFFQTQKPILTLTLLLTSVAIIGYNFAIFLDLYFVIYPKVTALDWADGNHQAITTALPFISQTSHLYVTPRLPFHYLAAYLPISPSIVQNIATHSAKLNYSPTKNITYLPKFEILPQTDTDVTVISAYNKNLLNKPNAQVINLATGDPIFIVWTNHDLN